MVTFVEGPVRVSVPATSANLGPGFDSLGLALDLRDHLEGEVVAEGLVVEVTGAGSGAVPLDETHLVVRSMRAAFDLLGGQPAGLRLSCTNVVPHARGLGSSSAAIVGGVFLARSLVAGGALLLDDEALFRLAADLEGHPDNVAPAMRGGFVISGHQGDAFYAVDSSVDPRVSAVVFIAPTPVSTEVARGLLPAQVPHAEAAADAGRTALLVAALAGRPEHLWLATRDYLHQDYRRPAMPDSLELVDRLRADGVAAVISGAGPTVLAFSDGVASSGTEELLGRAPQGWQVLALAIDSDGVRLA
ncbi:homoserine kinase [Nocardioides psychrotolerans]|uniref:Homoserine kinase n=1 Tax=Nocardioides psychrotolerans TaxID=1005945 RepID=A0A1I3EZE7_9ACTN|nr:homoserine kinase [Nocardioides psychrotolerans]GEP37930.1 homoserine kinase [Nocardioides psychrotolerans]SFI04374.1 homoserine kinase [Nocardioides psychrotolerans]